MSTTHSEEATSTSMTTTGSATSPQHEQEEEEAIVSHPQQHEQRESLERGVVMNDHELTCRNPKGGSRVTRNCVDIEENEEEPSCEVWRQFKTFWIFGIMLPSAALAWRLSGGRWSVTIASSFFIPLFAISQGTLGILTYRLYYGDAPEPLSPSHGVVCAVSTSSSFLWEEEGNRKKDETRTTDTTAQEPHNFVSMTGGCECHARLNDGNNNNNNDPQLSEESVRFLQKQQDGAVAHQLQQQLQQQIHSIQSASCLQQPESSSLFSEHHQQQRQQQQQQEPPLRLLVLGDSLAVGVGQKSSCTPIMPETIAKALSQKMNGRIVYWSSHGSTGASAGWLVRELERGHQPTTAAAAAESSCNNEDGTEHEECSEHIETTTSTITTPLSKIAPTRSSSSLSCCSDTDDDSASSEDEECACSSSESVAPVRRRNHMEDSQENSRTTDRSASFNTSSLPPTSRPSMAVWRDLLKDHRKLFEHPEYLGPYDIAVVLTGPNDLKGSCFPFLLTGEDAEFRRQAVERSGGSYRMELRRLLETLNRKMQWKNFQEFVSAATETVRGKMEETMELIIDTASSKSPSGSMASVAPTETTRLDEVKVASRTKDDDSVQHQGQSERKEHVPLIVLPGMPARALPIFQHVPLRWLAVPMTDMMDTHKRHIAKSHPEDVLFVEPPTERQISNYVLKKATETGRTNDQDGTVAHNAPSYESSDEKVLLALRDVKRRDCRRVEGAMRDYYRQRDLLGQKSTFSAYINNPFKLIRTHLFGFPPALHLKAFSPDGVHPNDHGYDFWGRHIADAIYEQYIARNQKR